MSLLDAIKKICKHVVSISRSTYRRTCGCPSNARSWREEWMRVSLLTPKMPCFLLSSFVGKSEFWMLTMMQTCAFMFNNVHLTITSLSSLDSVLVVTGSLAVHGKRECLVKAGMSKKQCFLTTSRHSVPSTAMT